MSRPSISVWRATGSDLAAHYAIRHRVFVNEQRVMEFTDVDAYDDGFAFVRCADASVFDLDRNEGIDPANNGAGCYMITDDADRWHTRLLAAGLPVTPIDDMPWGMREFTLTDPSGNHLRIGHSV